MKTLKIRYIVPLGGKICYQAFEKDKKGNFVFYDVEVLEAIRYINADYATPKDKAEYEKLLLEVKIFEADKKAKEKLFEDIKNLDSLKERKEKLSLELEDINKSISTVEIALGNEQ